MNTHQNETELGYITNIEYERYTVWCGPLLPGDEQVCDPISFVLPELTLASKMELLYNFGVAVAAAKEAGLNDCDWVHEPFLLGLGWAGMRELSFCFSTVTSPTESTFIVYPREFLTPPALRDFARCNSLAEAVDLLYNTTNPIATSNPPTNLKPVRVIIPSQLRFWVMRRDKYSCRICGRSKHVNPKLTLEVDHILPVAKGGTNDPENLQTLCFDCNRGKGKLLMFDKT